MGYAPPLEKAKLRSTSRLERAMKARDVNGSELAVLAKTSRQAISRLRRGQRDSLDRRTAQAIERVLHTTTGELFEYERDEAA